MKLFDYFLNDKFIIKKKNTIMNYNLRIYNYQNCYNPLLLIKNYKRMSFLS